MKPLKNLVPISSMTGIITALEKLRLSGAQIVRLQKILLGVGTQHLMAEGGYYPQENFYQLSKMLRYHRLNDMLKEIQDSRLFIIGMNRQNTAIQWLASPLYMSLDMVKNHLEDRPDGTETPLSSDAEYGGLFGGSDTCNVACKVAGLPPAPPSIFMTLTGKVVLPGGTAPAEACAPKALTKPQPRSLSDAEKTVFYDRWLRTLTGETIQIAFEHVRSHIRRVTGCTEEQARELLRQIMLGSIRRYMTSEDRFFRADDAGREAWLINTLHSDTMTRRIKDEWRHYHASLHRQHAQQHQQREVTARQNRPLSPYEWTDPDDQHRYYEDRLNGLTRIPDDMPPRPTENAYLSQDTWKQEQP